MQSALLPGAFVACFSSIVSFSFGVSFVSVQLTLVDQVLLMILVPDAVVLVNIQSQLYLGGAPILADMISISLVVLLLCCNVRAACLRQ